MTHNLFECQDLNFWGYEDGRMSVVKFRGRNMNQKQRYSDILLISSQFFHRPIKKLFL